MKIVFEPEFNAYNLDFVIVAKDDMPGEPYNNCCSIWPSWDSICL
jgi:hypothetical protein